MSFANTVPYILFFFRWLCYIVLLFYFLRVLIFIFWKSGAQHRLREAMAFGYTSVSAYFIFHSTDAIHPFVVDIQNAATVLVPNPAPWINHFLMFCACFVCVAFICNFSRSLWMLKSLDHARFEPVPNWESLSAESDRKRTFEFCIRALAALLFIGLEFRLEKLANSMVIGATRGLYLRDAGLFGLFLYFCLIVWWISGLLIAKSQMPKWLLLFYICGFGNSLFIFYYSGKLLTDVDALLLFIILLLVAAAALYMMVIVLADLWNVLLWKCIKNIAARFVSIGRWVLAQVS